ncbi:MAG: tetratricopeptide repeat protein [Rikenellaceae bacterium]|nr:tetratricopeptide repeat protein [Rikenellaceae bacterium]
MRYGGVIRAVMLALTLVMFSCGTLPRKRTLTDEEKIHPIDSISSISQISSPLTIKLDTVPPSDYPVDAHTLWHYVEGLKAYHLHNDSSKAHHHYERALAIDSNYAPAAYHTAAMLMIMNNADAAESYSLRAYRTDTTSHWFTTQLGRIQIYQEDYEEGIRLYSEMVRMKGNNPDNHRILAMLYYENQQPFSAIIVLDSAERRFGIHEAISPFKRQLLVATAQYDRALEQSEELIEADPYNIDNYIIAAELYAQAKKDSLALVNYDRALAIDSTSIGALGSLNEFYGMRGDHPNYLRTMVPLFASREVDLERKIKIFNRLTNNIDYYQKFYGQLNQLAITVAVTHPNDLEAMELYTTHLIATGDLDRALEIYKAHINDSVPRVEIFNTILDIESFKERPDSVEHYTRLAIERFPDRPEFTLRRGSYLLMNDKYKAAERAFRDALRKIDGDSLRGATLTMIGDAQYQDNRPRAAFRTYEKALRLLPNDAGLLNNYAYFLSEEGRDLDRALEMSERAITISKNNSTYLDTYAWIFYKLGRYDEAKRYMRQAITFDRTQSEVLMCHYGDILYALGENFMAQIYWEKARDNGYDKAEIESRLQKLKKP